MVLNPSRGQLWCRSLGALFRETLRRTMGRCPAASIQNLQQSTFLKAFRPDISGLGTRTNHMYERYTFTCRARWVSGGMDRWCACLWCLWADGALNPLMDCCFLSLPPQNNLTIPCVGLVVDIFLVWSSINSSYLSLSLSLSVSLCVCVCLCVLLCFSPLLSRVGWQTLNTTLLCC